MIVNDPNSFTEYILIGQDVGNQLLPHLPPQPTEYYNGWIQELIARRGYPEYDMEWHPYNVRAGSKFVVSGTLAEMITIIIAMATPNIFSNDLIICQEKDKQLAGVDVIDITNNVEIQTKTIINYHGTDRVYEAKEIVTPCTDFISLIDIDCYRCYIIRSNDLKQLIDTKTLYTQPGGARSYGWTCDPEELEAISVNDTFDTYDIYSKKRFSSDQCIAHEQK